MGIMVIDSVPPATMTSAPPSGDAIGGKRDGLQAGRAEAVDGHGRGFHRQAGAQRGDARHVHSLLGFGHGAAEDDILDFMHIELRDARQRALDGDGAQIVGTGGAQGSFGGFADRGADGAYNDSFSHDSLSPRSNLVAQRFAGFERELNPLLRLVFAAQALEGLALQVEQILLADRSARA